MADNDDDDDIDDDDDDILAGAEEEAGGLSSGLEALLENKATGYERLPMLEVVYDRLVRLLSTSLRNVTSENADVTLENINTTRFSDFMNEIEAPSLLAVFKAEEWDNFGLLVLDGKLVFTMIDLLMGGRHGKMVDMSVEGRNFTVIERNLMQTIANVILNDISVAFDPLCAISMRFERMEVNPRFAPIARPGSATIVAKFNIDMDEKGGGLRVVFPYATLEPIRELLLQMFMGEKFGRDSIWENHLASELWFTDIDINVVLDEFRMPLGQVMEWDKGSLLQLRTKPSSLVEIRSGHTPLFLAEMGQKGNRIAVRVREKDKSDKRERVS